jgi:hypothetical protein
VEQSFLTSGGHLLLVLIPLAGAIQYMKMLTTVLTHMHRESLSMAIALMSAALDQYLPPRLQSGRLAYRT